MIELHGLTEHQVELLDIIWNLDTKAEVDLFIECLNEDDQKMCYSLSQLLSVEIMDMTLDGISEFPEAKSVINHIKAL
jgi:hypothetical protein